MADLPPIPDEAFAAADAYLAGRFAPRYHPVYAQGVIERVWPHLYAAALRHAADQLDQGEVVDERYLAAGDLRRWADDVSPETNPDPQPQVETPKPGSKGRIGWSGPT